MLFQKLLSRLAHIILILLVTTIGFGQVKSQNARIVLKSGTIIDGKVLKIEYQKQIDLMVGVSDTLKINWEDVEQLDLLADTIVVPPSRREINKREKKDELFVDTSNYFYLSAGIPLGIDYFGDPVAGFSYIMAAGKGFNYRHHIGFRTGYEFYLWPEVNIIPLGFDYYGRLKPQGKSIYYGLSAGYGFVHVSEYRWYNNSNTKGGLFFNPYIGVTNKRHPKRSWFVEFGYKSQVMSASYDGFVWELNERSEARIEEKMNYQRIDVRVGLRFD